MQIIWNIISSHGNAQMSVFQSGKDILDSISWIMFVKSISKWNITETFSHLDFTVVLVKYFSFICFSNQNQCQPTNNVYINLVLADLTNISKCMKLERVTYPNPCSVASTVFCEMPSPKDNNVKQVRLSRIPLLVKSVSELDILALPANKS